MLVSARAHTYPATGPDAWCTWRVLITQQDWQDITADDLQFVLHRFRALNSSAFHHDTDDIPPAPAQPTTATTTTTHAPTSNPTDTNVRIVTRNIRGLADNLPALLRCRSDIYLVQEVDLIEFRVNELKADAMLAGYQLFFGEPTQLGADAASVYGRRTAIAVKSDYKVDSICSNTEESIKTLSASGRWVERLIHFSNECQILVASYYGISGSSIKGAKHT